MIFQRALLREFASIAGAVFLTLLAIALTTRLIRLLGQAAGGRIPTDAVMAFLGFFTIYILPMLLSLTLFISILLSLTRSYRDSEMVIWFSSGQPLTAWLKPVLVFALPLVGLIALLSLVISPWTAQMGEQYRTRVNTRDDISRVTPGTFGETSSRERVFFVESISGDQTVVRNVFVASSQHQRAGVSMSRTGRTETAPNGDRFIVLDQGRRYEGAPGEERYRVTEFEKYAARIELKEGAEPELTHKQLTTLALIAAPSNTNRGELVWRIGVPTAALILALLAIPMSFVNPRAGRSVNLLFALLTYMVYSNLLTVTQARVAQGKLDFAAGSWLVHAAMLAVLLLMFAFRMQLFRLPLRR